MPITSIRYLKEENLKAARKIHEGLYRQLIRSFGVDCTYFRRDWNFCAPSGETEVNNTYGEEPTAPFALSADIIMYMQMDNDTTLLNKFGIETDGDAQGFLLIEDFNEQFRDIIGEDRKHTFYEPFSGIVSAGLTDIKVDLTADYLSGYAPVSLQVPLISYDSTISGITSTQFLRYPKYYNEYIRTSDYYIEQLVIGEVKLNYMISTDLSGNGVISGSIDADLNYHSEPAKKHGNNWAIAPQVGDFFRIQFQNGKNQEEYEITSVVDRNLQSDGISPLLSRYVWKLGLTRRDPSHEIFTGGSTLIDGTDLELFDNFGNTLTPAVSATEETKLQEPYTINKLESNAYIEIESNREFNYGIQNVDKYDRVSSDLTYGGYGIYSVVQKPVDTPPNPPLPPPLPPLPIVPPPSTITSPNDIDTFIAGEDIPAFRFVQFNPQGNVMLANPTNVSNVIGLSITSAVNGQLVSIQTDNLIIVPSFNLIPNTAVFLGYNGTLTQVVPQNYIHNPAFAISATALQLNTDYDIVI